MAVLLAIYVLLMVLLAILFAGPVPSLALVVLGAPLIAVIEISMNPFAAILVSANRLFLIVAIIHAIVYALLTATATFVALWIATDILGLTLPLSLKVALAVAVFLFVHTLVSRILWL